MERDGHDLLFRVTLTHAQVGLPWPTQPHHLSLISRVSFSCLCFQVGSLKGKEGDATPFMDVTVDDVAKELHELGYQKYGNETMYSGHTGKIKIAPLSPYPLRPGDHELLPASSLLRFYRPVPCITSDIYVCVI